MYPTAIIRPPARRLLRDFRNRKGTFFRNDEDDNELRSCKAFSWTPISRAQKAAITGNIKAQEPRFRVRAGSSLFFCTASVQRSGFARLFAQLPRFDRRPRGTMDCYSF